MNNVRLFRLYDENEDEIGFGVFHPATGNVAFKHKDFLGYQAATSIRAPLSQCHSFMWCCPNSQSWHGHEKMTARTRKNDTALTKE